MFEEEQRFTCEIMSVMRIFITSWVFVFAFSIGINGIAAAASGVAHEIHCADRLDGADNLGADHGQKLHHIEDLATSDAEHDHESCMLHACPALFPEADKHEAEPHQLLTKLLFVDPPLQVFERVESLHRPPNT